MRRIRIISAILATTILMGAAAGCSAAEEADTEDDSEITLDVYSFEHDEDISYVHYDPQMFLEALDTLRALADTGDADRVNSFYDTLYEEYEYIDTLYALAYIEYSKDTSSTEAAEEDSYAVSLLNSVTDSFCSACAYILNETSCADSFAEHLGEGTADELRSYVKGDTSTDSLTEQETEFVNEYYELATSSTPFSCEVDGVIWTNEMLAGEEGTALAAEDYDQYAAIYMALQAATVEQYANIYASLVSIRKNIADKAGYGSYANYAYNEIYGRSYSMGDAQTLCDAVKPYAQKYFEKYKNASILDAEDITIDVDDEMFLSVLSNFIPELSADIKDAWESMISEGNHDIGTGEHRISSSYTIDLPALGHAFVFVNTGSMGTTQKVSTITHEFGHYAYFCLNGSGNLLVSAQDYDLLETHSNGMQAIATVYYDGIYSEGAEIAKYSNLCSILEDLIYGCIYDEFQRKVYETSEPLTAESINTIFTEVCGEYGLYINYDDALLENLWDASWTYVHHNFDQPLYYISYAASSFAALQLYNTAMTDDGLDTAIASYTKILTSDADAGSYLKVLADSGLMDFSNSEDVTAVIEQSISNLKSIKNNLEALPVHGDVATESNEEVLQ